MRPLVNLRRSEKYSRSKAWSISVRFDRAHRFVVAEVEITNFPGPDVAGADSADAAVRPQEGIPRLEMIQQSRFHIRMSVQIVVDPVGVGVHQSLKPRGTVLEILFCIIGINHQPVIEVAGKGGFTFEFRDSPQLFDVIHFNAAEVVFALGIHQSEHCVGISLAVNMRNPPGVTDNGDLGGLALPSGHILLTSGLGREKIGKKEEKQNGFFHGCSSLLIE